MDVTTKSEFVNESYNFMMFLLNEIPILKLSSNPLLMSPYSSSNF